MTNHSGVSTAESIIFFIRTATKKLWELTDNKTEAEGLFQWLPSVYYTCTLYTDVIPISL